MAATPDPSNIQGFILRGYTHPYSCHLLFSFKASGVTFNSKAFFSDLYPKVQSGSDWGSNKPLSMLNIGISFLGLQILGVAAQKNSHFPAEFQEGPWSTGSQMSLGDFDSSAPNNWWNQKFASEDVHCIVHTYGLTQSDLDQLITFVTTSATTNGLTELLPLNDGDGRLYQSIVENDPAKIHFGYVDGISEPSLAYPNDGSKNQQNLDNFLIGYPTNSVSDPGPVAFNAKNPDLESQFAFDGCYNAFRVLYQDVAGFDNFLTQQATANASTLSYLGKNQAELEEWFAAKLIGRWRNGSPLMLSPDNPDPATSHAEDFGYASTDPSIPAGSQDVPSSFRCPFSAHTRVTNPRDQQLNASQGEGIYGPPRIIRRGMPYGEELVAGKNDSADRGLIGLFFCGSIARQFEKLYGWMNYNNFSPKQDYSVQHPPQDALLGDRPSAQNSINFPGVVNSFTIPLENNNTQLTPLTINALPLFIETRGTAYCLLPSLKSIQYLATGVMPSS